MPPTLPNQSEAASSIDTGHRFGHEWYKSCHARRSSERARLFTRHSHAIHHRRSPASLWHRQYLKTVSPSDQPANAPPLSSDSFVPYTPTVLLHAKIIPLESYSSNHDTADSLLTSGRLSATGIVLIVGGALIAVILAVMGLYVTRSLIFKKGSRILRYGYQRRKLQGQGTKESLTASNPEAMEGYDELSWGAQTRYMYVKSISDIHDIRAQEPERSSDSTHTLSSLPTWSTLGQRGSPAVHNEPDFQEQLRYAGDSSASVLDLAPRDREAQAEKVLDLPAIDFTTVTRRAFSHLCHEGDVSIFRSLQASIDKLAQGASIHSIQNRPRQGSDASESSNETTISPEIMDCFSTASSRTSMTSISSIESKFEEDLEATYEVKHAQAKIVEIEKGVLVTCQPTTPIYADTTGHDVLPTVVISEPLPSLPVLEDPVHTTFDIYQTVEPLTFPLVREGTIDSLSTSFSTTTRTEGWCSDEDDFLQLPVVPYLMVTRPSDSSIHTAGSNASSVSIDLNEFPLPPTPVKQSYYSQLMNHIRDRKRFWDNHSADSNVAQRRSTVEQFITMYASSST